MNPRNTPILYSCLIAFAVASGMCTIPVIGQTITRGPYLQNGTPSSVVIRWRTDVASDSRVTFVRQGSSDSPSVINGSGSGTEHEIQVSGLQPDTTYTYTVGSSAGVLAGDATHFFTTSPVHGSEKPTRVWVIGDSGQVSSVNNDVRDVRDGYYTFNGNPHSDVWLMLGDNAYNNGTDQEYQTAVFDVFQQSLRNTILWSTRGNHDRVGNGTTPYFDIFTLPTNGEGGGVASTREDYYSFDYANIHFVCLDSYGLRTSTAQQDWLVADLASTTQDWIIAYFHHPPYTKGSHDSDIESDLVYMRQVYMPILETYGVDMVLNGHSHSYERTYFINQHHGDSNSYDANVHALDAGNGRVNEDGAYEKLNSAGVVQVVAGSSGKLSFTSRTQHPCHYVRLFELGSMAIDVDGLVLDASFVDMNGTVRDSFRISKEPPSDCSVSAGPNQVIDLSADATLDGTVISCSNAVAWSNVSGPGSVTFSNPSQEDTLASFSVPGTYTLRLSADNQSDEVTITVENNNVPPSFFHCGGTSELVSLGDNWTYLDDGSNQGTAWQTLAFDDSSWASGNGQLGYGDGDETTVLSFGGDPNDKHITTYFRKSINIPNADTISAMDITYLRDDGMALHLNGTEIHLDNMPSSYDYTTLSSAVVGGADESALQTYSLTAAELALLVDGDNVIAAEIHQRRETSSDISFDAKVEIESTNACFETSFATYQGDTLTATFTAEDPDPATTLSYSITNGEQTGMTVNQSGSFTWNIPPDQPVGVYSVEISATDDYPIPGSGSITIQLSVLANQAPTVSISGPGEAVLPGTTMLMAIATDDGIPNGTLSYAWLQIAGPGSATIDSPNDIDIEISFPTTGTYTFLAVVSDGARTGSATKTVEAIANSPPAISLAAQHLTLLSMPLTLSPSVSDDGRPMDMITYQWSGPPGVSFSSANTLLTTATFPALGTYTLTLTASDGQLTDSVSTKVMVVQNTRPVVDAGTDFAVTFGNPINLDASVMDEGFPTSPPTYQWSLISGPGSVTFNSPNSEDTSVTVSTPGIYTFQLEANDGDLTGSDTVQVTTRVPNDPPVVNAGSDSTFTLPGLLMLDGTVSDDGAPNNFLFHSWTLVSGPASVYFNSPFAEDSSVVVSFPGTYVFMLTVTDGLDTSSDTVVITVNPLNNPPVVDAGPNQTVNLPNQILVAGTANDDGAPNGTLTVNWSKTSGPGAVSFNTPNALTSSVVVGSTGTYVLTLTATDGAATATDSMTIIVNPANQPPSVNAGPDQSITLPNPAALSGVATDDGIPSNSLTYLWTQTAGPSPASLTSTTIPNPAVAFFESGTYEFQLTVSDSVLSRSDRVVINVVEDGATSLSRRVQAGEDDAEYFASGNFVYLSSADLDLGSISSGVRFRNVQIPQGAQIQSAQLVFHSYRTGTLCDTLIEGHAVDDSPAFNQTTNALQDNNPTGAKVSWKLPATPVNGPCVSPDVTAIVQEIVNRPGWSPGNAMSMTLSVLSGQQETIAYESNPTLAARLDITFEPAGMNNAPLVDAGPDRSSTLAGITIDATVIDESLQTTGVSWSKVSGPGAAIFADSNAIDTHVSFTAPGSYTLRLSAFDGEFTSVDEVTIMVSAGNQTLTLLTSSVHDDGEGYRSFNYSYTRSTDLDLGVLECGVRFQGVAIPAGSFIVDARVEFTSYRQGQNATTMIRGLNADNSPNFVSAANGIRGGSHTSNEMAWSVPATPQGTTFSTPNLASIVQELVTRPGWTTGNALNLIFLKGTGRQEASAYDYRPAEAPRLIIEFAPSAARPGAPAESLAGIRQLASPAPGQTAVVSGNIELPSIALDHSLVVYAPTEAQELHLIPSKSPTRMRIAHTPPAFGEAVELLSLNTEGELATQTQAAANLLLQGFTDGAVILDTSTPYDPILLTGEILEGTSEFGIYIKADENMSLEARNIVPLGPEE